MAWTTPRTWADGELVTATMMNAHVRDNDNALRDYLIGAQDLGADFKFIGPHNLLFTDTGVAHGMTALAATDCYGYLGPWAAGTGGIRLEGLSESDAAAAVVFGIVGSTTPTIPPIVFRGDKKSGTGQQALASTEKLAAFNTNGVDQLNVYGDGALEWHSASVAHGMTSHWPTDVYGRINTWSSTEGGLLVRGITETETALYLAGFAGAASPTSAPVHIDAYKKSGTTVQALALSEPILTVKNGGTKELTLYGDGGLSLGIASASCWIGFNGATTTGGNGIQYSYHATNAEISLSALSDGVSFYKGTPSFRPASDNATYLGEAARRWAVVYAGNGTIQTSDGRSKKNIRAVPYGLRELKLLRPVAFEWEDGAAPPEFLARASLGLIAQEVNAVVPEAVFEPENPLGEWGMAYDRLVPVLVRAVQELAADVAKLGPPKP